MMKKFTAEEVRRQIEREHEKKVKKEVKLAKNLIKLAKQKSMFEIYSNVVFSEAARKQITNLGFKICEERGLTVIRW